jgi:hypothetical protein
MRFARQPEAGSLLAAASGSATDLRRVKMLAKIGELWDPAAGRCPGAGSEIRMSRNGRFAGPVIGLRFETPHVFGIRGQRWNLRVPGRRRVRVDIDKRARTPTLKESYAAPFPAARSMEINSTDGTIEGERTA